MLDMFSIVHLIEADRSNTRAMLSIYFAFQQSLFGKVLIAETAKGIIHVAFVTKESVALKELYARFPKATFAPVPKIIQRGVLHLRGTDFQLKVWKALLKIPAGKLITYGELAKRVGKPRAVRAVASAVGANPVAILIPCHRVIPASGGTGKYHWGSDRKAKMITSEATRLPRDK